MKCKETKETQIDENLMNDVYQELQNVLSRADGSAKIDLSYIQDKINMQLERKELLAQHPNSIKQGPDGYWRTYLPSVNGKRKLIKKSTREKLEDALVEYMTKEDINPTVREVFDEWNAWALSMKKIAPATYSRNQQTFNRHYEEFGNRKIKSVSVDDFVNFLERQIPEHQLTAKAFANLKCITGKFIKRAKRRKLIDYTADDVFHQIDTSDREFKQIVKDDSEEVFNVEETDKIIRYLIENPDIWNLGLLLMFVSGLRVGELVALHWEDFKSDVILVRRTETRFQDDNGKYIYQVKDFPKTKAGVRTVAIPQAFHWIYDAVRELHDDEEFVFVHNGVRMRTTCMRKRFQRICEKLEIPPRSPHKIRKTYCTILFENKLDSKLITKQMGHTDISCSEIHYHRFRGDVEEAIEKVSAIPEFQQKLTLIS